MNASRSNELSRLVLLSLAIAGTPAWLLGQSGEPNDPIRRTVAFHGTQREYFVRLPPRFDHNKSYWPLVVIHGAGGNGRTFFMANGISRVVAELGFDAIVISPTFPNDDDNVSRFPALGEGDFLEAVLGELRREYVLKSKMLLTGYSRGGQFAHRFALKHPEQVEAVAAFASGTWTTPDGRFLVEELGEVRDARAFLSDATNASSVPARLRDLFEPRVAAVAEALAAAGAREIPFFIMCGALDPRLPIAKQFVQSLDALGYHVEFEWPLTPHGCGNESCRAEYAAEFAKYSRSAVEFFYGIGRAR